MICNADKSNQRTLTVQLYGWIILQRWLWRMVTTSHMKQLSMLLSRSDSCKNVYSAKLSLSPISTHQNIADILTKQSAGPQFRLHRNYIFGISDTVDLRVSAMVAYVSRASLSQFDAVVDNTAGNAFLLGRSVIRQILGSRQC